MNVYQIQYKNYCLCVRIALYFLRQVQSFLSSLEDGVYGNAVDCVSYEASDADVDDLCRKEVLLLYWWLCFESLESYGAGGDDVVSVD